MSEAFLTNTSSPPRWKLVNFCRKECNALADEDGGQFERHVGGPWMLAADVLPALEALRSQLTAGVVLADAVEVVIQAQTNRTIDIVGMDKMKAQKKALDDFRKAVKGETK